ncbi:hypothetical protein D3C71_598720 [compost metagenome]
MIASDPVIKSNSTLTSNSSCIVRSVFNLSKRISFRIRNILLPICFTSVPSRRIVSGCSARSSHCSRLTWYTGYRSVFHIKIPVTVRSSRSIFIQLFIILNPRIGLRNRQNLNHTASLIIIDRFSYYRMIIRIQSRNYLTRA